MVSKLVAAVESKITKKELLFISMECAGFQALNAIYPECILAEEGNIHIEGGKMILDLSNDVLYTITYNEDENEFTIKQDGVNYYIS